jgi:hypothetical protein
MNECPKEEEVAAVVAGDVRAKRSNDLIQHILRCPKCRKLAAKFRNLDVLLACARVDPDGTVKIEEPKVSEEFARKLQETARDAFRRKQERRSRLRAFLEEVMEEVLEPDARLPGQPALVGYFATRPGKEEPPKEDSGPELRERFCEELTSLLEVLLDPRMPFRERISVIEELSRQLKTHLEETS